TGASRRSVDVHRAGTALGDPAAVFGAEQAKRIPQYPQQRRLRIDIDIVGPSVHFKTRHGSPPTKLQNGGSIGLRLVQKNRAHKIRGSRMKRWSAVAAPARLTHLAAAESGGRPWPPASFSLRERDVVVSERHRAHALTRRGKVRVEHRRRGDADRRLADAAPETARRHDDRFHLRHL